MSKKLLWIIGSIVVGITILAVGSFTIYKSGFFSKESIAVVESEESFPQYDQLTVDIAEYEYYYNDPFFYTKQAAKFYGLTMALGNNALFHHLESHGYTWDEEKINRIMQQERDALAYTMKNPTLRAYYEKLFNDLNITSEQYIEHYAFIKIKAKKMEMEMFEKSIGLDENGAYPTSDAFETYIGLVGVTKQQLDELASKIPEPLKPAPEQIALPFLYEGNPAQVALNEDGQYIFTSMQLPLVLEWEHMELCYELERLVHFELTRVTFPLYVEALENYEPEDESKQQVKEDLKLYFEILDRTMNSL